MRPPAAWSCGTSTATSTPPLSTPLTVTSISFAPGQIWPINRPVDVTFDRAIQFGSVSLSTLRFETALGDIAPGSFVQPLDANGNVQRNVVRFEPVCPSDLAGSDAGFAPGGVMYTLRIAGLDQGNTTILADDNEGVADTFVESFITPSTSDPSQLFFDPVPGPAEIVVRGANGVSDFATDSTYVEIGTTACKGLIFKGS